MKVLIGLLIVMLLALQYRLWFGDGSLQEVWRLGKEARAIQATLDDMRSRNQALAAEVADLKSGLDAIEERARAELGMVEENETFYQFVKKAGSESAANEASANEASTIPQAVQNNVALEPSPGDSPEPVAQEEGASSNSNASASDTATDKPQPSPADSVVITPVEVPVAVPVPNDGGE